MRLGGRPLAPGEGRGPALVLSAPLSFWGGVDALTGRIIEARHPQHGATVTGRVVMLPASRGSSSSSSVLAEAIRLRTAPAAIVLGEPDLILPLGALVAAELYGMVCPVVVADFGQGGCPADGQAVAVHADGTVEW